MRGTTCIEGTQVPSTHIPVRGVNGGVYRAHGASSRSSGATTVQADPGACTNRPFSLGCLAGNSPSTLLYCSIGAPLCQAIFA